MKFKYRILICGWLCNPYCVHFIPPSHIRGTLSFHSKFNSLHWLHSPFKLCCFWPTPLRYPILAHALLWQFCAFYLSLCLCCGNFCLCIFVCLIGDPLPAGPSPYRTVALLVESSSNAFKAATQPPRPPCRTVWPHGHNGLSIHIHSYPWASHSDNIGILKSALATQSPKATIRQKTLYVKTPQLTHSLHIKCPSKRNKLKLS